MMSGPLRESGRNGTLRTGGFTTLPALYACNSLGTVLGCDAQICGHEEDRVLPLGRTSDHHNAST